MWSSRGARISCLTKRALSSPLSCRHESSGTLPMPPCSHSPPKYKGPPYEEIKKIRETKLNSALVPHFKTPLLVTSGHMQWLYDEKGTRYLDLFGGIVTVSVGHCHPKVTSAAIDQLNTLWHTTNIYYHPKIHEFAQKLTDKLPGDLKVVYFVNSGSEANDMAMMMSRIYTGNFDVISLRNAYHGASPYTAGLTAISTWKHKFANGFGIHHASNPDPYQGLWGGYRDSCVQSLRAEESTLEAGGSCSSADLYVDQLREVIKCSVARESPAAFFAESIQGVGGTVQFPKGYLKKAFELVRSHGGLCVSDEVQTGFGRTGEHFWGFEGHDVIPDIVTMAKGIGNGFPLAAVVTTPEVASVMSTALHFNTYGGNPISCAVGSAVLDVIEEDKTQENSAIVGQKFLKGLEKLRDEFEIIGDVRGKGLMIGIEMVADRQTRSALPADTMANIWETCKDMGVILGRGGPRGTVFRIKPPMCITEDDANFALSVFKYALEKEQK